MELPGVQTGTWGPPVRMVADRLGVELDEIRETYEKRVTDRDARGRGGTIEAGTVGAVRFETIGVVDGRDAIVIEHVNRMAPDLAPEWPTADRDGTYRIVIEGEPDLTCELTRRHARDRDRTTAWSPPRCASSTRSPTCATPPPASSPPSTSPSRRPSTPP